MNRRPKRRRSKDNPYILDYDEESGIAIISFKDNKNIYHSIEVENKLYDAFNNFELEDLSFMNEYDNHIEHSQLYDQTLFQRAANHEKLLETVIEEKILIEEIKHIIEELPEIQKRRFKKYYYEGKSFTEISKDEKCTKRAVKFSVDIALQKIIKKIKI